MRIATLEESARLCLESGNHEEALAAVDGWLGLDPGNDAALELRSRTTAALEARLREIEHRKRGEEAKATGLALLAKGDYRASVEALERARELLGDQTVIRVAMEEAATGLRAESVRRQRREEARPLRAKAAADAAPSVRDSPQSLIPSPDIRKPDAATLTRSVPQSAAVPSGSPTTTGLEIPVPLAETPPPAKPSHTAGTQAADVKIPESRSTPEEHQEAAPASPKREAAENPPLMRPCENLAASAPARPNPFRTTPPSLDREVMSCRNRGNNRPHSRRNTLTPWEAAPEY